MWRTILYSILAFYGLLIIPLIIYIAVAGIRSYCMKSTATTPTPINSAASISHSSLSSSSASSINLSPSNGRISSPNGRPSRAQSQSYTTTPKRIQVQTSSTINGGSRAAVGHSRQLTSPIPLLSSPTPTPKSAAATQAYQACLRVAQSTELFSPKELMTRPITPTTSTLQGTNHSPKKPLITRLSSNDSVDGDEQEVPHTLLRLGSSTSQTSSSADEAASSAAELTSEDDFSDDGEIKALETYFTQHTQPPTPLHTLLSPTRSDESRPGLSRPCSSELHARGIVSMSILPSPPATPLHLNQTFNFDPASAASSPVTSPTNGATFTSPISRMKFMSPSASLLAAAKRQQLATSPAASDYRYSSPLATMQLSSPRYV